tara:strand:- start:39 stop:281 length:243 start_codon:yes stop_codon:yes gene_type:complete
MFIDISDYLIVDKSKDWQKVSMVINTRNIIVISRSRVLPTTKKGRAKYKYFIRVDDFTKREIEVNKEGYLAIRKYLLEEL